MWYDKRGAGDPLVMLHPGGVDSRALEPNAREFAKHFQIFLPEQRGHGHTADTGQLSFREMVDDTIMFIEQVVGGPALLMGVSDGSIVALLVAHKRPDLVKRLVCVAAPFNWSGWDAGVIEDTKSNPPAFMADMYGEVSPDGKEHYAVIAKKLAATHVSEPSLTAESLRQITCRTLVMIGDDDEVTLEHAAAFYRGLPDSELAVIPGTSHGLLVEKPELCNAIILDFLSHGPIQTLAPRRRVQRPNGFRTGISSRSEP
jgi:pimeloyl-ACP methyl ester carboxylesterase